MKIKSLLLGSAAASMLAVTGAQAADPIIYAEPEPMEYVRVCDVYGAGFYYIPGTETCLRVGGYVRYDIGIGAHGHQDVLDKQHLDEFLAGERDFDDVATRDTYFKRARGTLILDARNESEWGTVRGYIEVDFNYDTITTTVFDEENDEDVGPVTSTEDNIGIRAAYIELGGLRIGKDHSLFSTFTGYAGSVINDGLIGFGRFGTHLIQYRYNDPSGFRAAVSLEYGSGVTYALDSYLPHIIGGLGYEQSWGGVNVVAGYDSVWDEWAVKGRLDANFGMGSAFVMAGYKSNEVGPNWMAPWGGHWALWGGAHVDMTEQFRLAGQLSYDADKTFGAVLSANWTPVSTLSDSRTLNIRPELTYRKPDGESGEWGGYLRFQRSF